MGGHLSCMYAGMSSANREPCINNNGSAGVLKVVLAYEGRTCEFSEPVKVAELMLEFPNHFVAEFVHGGKHVPPPAPGASTTAPMPVHSKRVSPLPADHDAQLSHVYLLLPMHRLNTRLSADELSVISTLAATPAAPTTATPQCASQSLAKATHTSCKVTPLSARHYQEAAAAHTPAACDNNSGNCNVSIAKSYSVPILELLEKVGSMEQCDADKNANQHLHILRSKSWTPKLETILESAHLVYL
ncbi:hypothetical protein GOP47_0018251 [Adiantum capillus-veneris]|uniref:Uncharacterized protein n=1 Tax=Adiantum capillus-veneris TaxID=13818 RepID=A0A9D4UGX3_ADICA|nr:hypothetical protein GOP47_0018251 [Adiantum capillus-veneris]